VTRSRRTDLVIVAVALVVAALAAVSIVVLGSQGSGGGATVSRGEAIFQSGVDANGGLIARSASGTGMMGGGDMMGGGMMGAGCATCHGANLTDPQGMLMPDGTRGPTYTEAGIRTAVTQGLDPAGSRLESPMPQWRLTGPQWIDLFAYLKTLN
jgi:mono/diheme cytochrome c family protein